MNALGDAIVFTMGIWLLHLGMEHHEGRSRVDVILLLVGAGVLLGVSLLRLVLVPR